MWKLNAYSQWPCRPQSVSYYFYSYFFFLSCNKIHQPSSATRWSLFFFTHDIAKKHVRTMAVVRKYTSSPVGSGRICPVCMFTGRNGAAVFASKYNIKNINKTHRLSMYLSLSNFFLFYCRKPDPVLDQIPFWVNLKEERYA